MNLDKAAPEDGRPSALAQVRPTRARLPRLTFPKEEHVRGTKVTFIKI